MPPKEDLPPAEKTRISFRLKFRLFLVNDLPTILVLFLWIVINISLFLIQFFEYHRGIKYFYLRVLISDGVSIARASALCLNFNCLLILLPVCRNLLSLIRFIVPRFSPHSAIRRFTLRLFDQHIEFHRCVAYAICFWSVIHIGAHVYNYERFLDTHLEHGTLADALNQLYMASSQSQLNPFRIVDKNFLGVGGMLTTIAGITGVIIFLCLLIMVGSSTSLIRRSFYEIFWYVHHLFIVFFVGLMIHGIQGLVKSQTNIDEHNPQYCAPLYLEWSKHDQCRIYPRFAGAKPASWMWLCAPLTIYIIERILRFVRSLQAVELINAIRHESNVIEIRFRKKSMLTPQPGQYIYVKCFSIAKFEWHPFTVTSAAEDDYVSVHIRTIGNWTKELATTLSKYPENVPRLSIDGPYGSPADDVFNYDGVVLVGAGIGGKRKIIDQIVLHNHLILVTPYAAILKHIRSSQSVNLRLCRVSFYWMCNTTACYEWFAHMLQDIERELRDRPNFLTYNIYLTQWSMTQARQAVQNNAETRDIWTGLQSKTHYGRPNFEADFQILIDEEWRTNVRKDIGVFVCGPKPLAKQLQQICIKMNHNDRTRDRARFYLNKENF